jgi:gliding motility-associated lipoprotein GldH
MAIMLTKIIAVENITTEKESLKMRNLIYLFILCVLVASCNDNLVHSEYKSVDGAVWDKDDIIEFSFSEIDSLQEYDMFINIRNNEKFPYSNLFLIASLNTPEGEVLKDTLEYTMAQPDGTWLGKGNGSIKENKLWYKENIVFSTSGVYTLEVSHAMRKNGTVSGVIGLEGITDVGIEITKTTP